MKLDKKSIFISKENSKYLYCCNILMYHYFKSENEFVSIKEILHSMDGDYSENKKILLRVFNMLGKNILCGVTQLTYSDYLKLEGIVNEYKSFRFQLAPYIASVVALSLSCISIFKDEVPFGILSIVVITLIIIFVFTINKIFK